MSYYLLTSKKPKLYTQHICYICYIKIKITKFAILLDIYIYQEDERRLEVCIRVIAVSH